MHASFSTAAAAVLALAAPAALAAGGQIDNFGASTTQVVEGGSVDFSVSYTVFASSSINGGSDLNEPAPQEGDQFWLLNWYDRQTETVREVTLEAAGQSFNDFSGGFPGSSVAGGWNFTVVFPTAGRYDIAVSGSWRAEVSRESGSEQATRSCFSLYPDGFSCSSWAYSYPQLSDQSSEGGSLFASAITIEVLAAVPEPATGALMLAGLGLVGGVNAAAARRRRARA